MDAKEKYIELAKKLKALADQGIGGEKINAKSKLDALIHKLGLTIEDLGIDEVKEFSFKIGAVRRKFFNQISASVTGNGYRFYSKTKVFCNCTQAEAIEIQLKFNFYWPEFRRQRDTFFLAFIKANHLYRAGVTKKWDDLTQEQQRQYEEVSRMAQGVDTLEFRKQLKG